MMTHAPHAVVIKSMIAPQSQRPDNLKMLSCCFVASIVSELQELAGMRHMLVVTPCAQSQQCGACVQRRPHIEMGLHLQLDIRCPRSALQVKKHVSHVELFVMREVVNLK